MTSNAPASHDISYGEPLFKYYRSSSNEIAISIMLASFALISGGLLVAKTIVFGFLFEPISSVILLLFSLFMSFATWKVIRPVFYVKQDKQEGKAMITLYQTGIEFNSKYATPGLYEYVYWSWGQIAEIYIGDQQSIIGQGPRHYKVRRYFLSVKLKKIEEHTQVIALGDDFDELDRLLKEIVPDKKYTTLS